MESMFTLRKIHFSMVHCRASYAASSTIPPIPFPPLYSTMKNNNPLLGDDDDDDDDNIPQRTEVEDDTTGNFDGANPTYLVQIPSAPPPVHVAQPVYSPLRAHSATTNDPQAPHATNSNSNINQSQGSTLSIPVHDNGQPSTPTVSSPPAARHTSPRASTSSSAKRIPCATKYSNVHNDEEDEIISRSIQDIVRRSVALLSGSTPPELNDRDDEDFITIRRRRVRVSSLLASRLPERSHNDPTPL